MIAAAQAGRRFWALAGTWLETERAEYRLAMTWLQAGDATQARHHAQQCLAIVQANGGRGPGALLRLSRPWRWPSSGRPYRRGRAAVAQAREAFAALEEGDRGWCQATLDKLDARARP